MKGIVLAGGLGTRLDPLTRVMNKHLLPLHNKPMIFYPLEMLAEAGIDEVMIVVGGKSTEAIIKLCGNGKQWGFKRLYYAYQEGEGGIAAALALTEEFVHNDICCVVLGDNLMLGDSLKKYRESFRGYGAMVLLAAVSDPQNYGVPSFDGEKEIVEIREKPTNPTSGYGVVGVYFYDGGLFAAIRKCTPSARGELEITDVNNIYARARRLSYCFVEGTWIDAGSSIEAWVHAGVLVKNYLDEKVRKDLGNDIVMANKG